MMCYNTKTMLEEKIYNDYVKALKSRDKEKSGFLSFVRADLKNIAINNKKEKLADEDVLSALKKQKKQLQETVESTAGGKPELSAQAKKEITMLDEYLPQPLADDELLAVINQAVTDVGAVSIKDMGKVMKEVLAKVGVRADAKKTSELVKNKLSS
ncbi:MAG: GatB/YqeY domain-containing protein [Candidatus Omnitrophota bacterium]